MTGVTMYINYCNNSWRKKKMAGYNTLNTKQFSHFIKKLLLYIIELNNNGFFLPNIKDNHF